MHMARDEIAATPRSMGARYWEIDALRGVAIIMMILFHLGWDLHYFRLSPIDVFDEPWNWWGRATATLFLLLVGVSLHLSGQRAARVGGEATIWRRQLRRSLVVLAGALAVTIVTWLAFGRGFVVFGILHLIGTSMLLAYPFRRLGRWNLVPALLFLLGGQLVAPIIVGFPWLVWLGLRPAGFFSVDYYPLLPWFGLVLVGLALGGQLYDQTGRRLHLPAVDRWPPLRLLGLLGRHSLMIYLLHQPLLIGVLVGLGFVPLSALGAG